VYKIIEGQKSKKNKTTLSLRYFLYAKIKAIRNKNLDIIETVVKL
jgi:hypothetical protein